MNKEEIKKILPHREPMLLLDEVSLDDEGYACGSYTVRGDEWFLQGHFPGNPVVPGVIQCEILAQTCCVLLGQSAADPDFTPFFTGLDKVKFRKPVTPGDVFSTRCKITREKAPFYFAQGEGSVDGKTVVRADFSFALVKTPK